MLTIDLTIEELKSITAGSLTYYFLWRPLSDGASLT